MKLYKVVTEKQWEQSRCQPLLLLEETDKKFIHLLTSDDALESIARKFFPQQAKVVVLTLDSDKLEGRLVFEANRPGGSLYPHLYKGSIPMQAVLEVKNLVLQVSEK
jgi:uncharacterized protein (DUF952 family)